MDSDSINKSLNTLSINESSPSIENSVSLDDVTLRDITANVLSKKPQCMEKNPPVDLPRPPPHNVTEKIIFCLDSVADINTTAFKISDYPYSSLSMLKRVVEIFVLNKSSIDAKHEYAVLSFDKRNVRWNQELSNNPRDVIKSLDNVYESECQDTEFDLSAILEQVWQMIKVPKPENDITVPPPYIVRLILLYSRNCKPILKKDFKELLVNPYFVIDVILTHEEKVDDNEQQEIFDSLCIDEKVYSYKFAVGTNASLLHESVAKLLAHPLQRPLQDQVVYKNTTYE